MKSLDGMVLPSKSIVCESLTTFFCCVPCAFAILYMLLPAANKVPATKTIITDATSTSTLFLFCFINMVPKSSLIKPFDYVLCFFYFLHRHSFHSHSLVIIFL